MDHSSLTGNSHTTSQGGEVPSLRTLQGRFKNPFPTWRGHPSVFSILKLFTHFAYESFLLTIRRNGGGAPGCKDYQQLQKTLPLHKPSFTTSSSTVTEEAPSNSKNEEINNGVRLRYTWLGHASILFQFIFQNPSSSPSSSKRNHNYKEMNILCDPVFSSRASAFSFIGPKRYGPVVIHYIKKDLPAKIDVVVISHNHMDHLDMRTIYELEEVFGGCQEKTDGIQYFVPMGLREWLIRRLGKGKRKYIEERVREFDWWDHVDVDLDLGGSGGEDGGARELPGVEGNRKVRFMFVPAQHWSGRTLFDRDQSLWGGWLMYNTFMNNSFIDSDTEKNICKKSAYFAGDTGWTGRNLFEIIGKVVGPSSIDIAAIPIGAYNPRDFMKSQHVNPEEAYELFKAVGAKKAFAIHWGTFPMTFEHYLEPKRRLEAIGDHRFFVLAHGESRFAD